MDFDKIVDWCDSLEEAKAMQHHYQKYGGHMYHYFYGEVKKGIRYYQKGAYVL